MVTGANRHATWAVLLSEIAHGRGEAMAKFYDETCHIVYSLARRVLSNPSDAEEVTLDVYTQVWRTAASYRRERGSVFSWLMNLARSRAIDRLRASRLRNAAPLVEAQSVPDDQYDPQDLAELSQRRRIIRQALGQLPREQRTAIELAFYSGLTHSELAEKPGEPLGTVKTRIRSGMLKLRIALGDLA